jgi:hypothetical protein
MVTCPLSEFFCVKVTLIFPESIAEKKSTVSELPTLSALNIEFKDNGKQTGRIANNTVKQILNVIFMPKPVWAIGFALEQPLRDAALACSVSGTSEQLEYASTVSELFEPFRQSRFFINK